MTWVLLQPLAAVKKSRITLKLVVPEKRGRPSLQVSIPSVMSGPLGLDAEGVEAANVYLGQDGSDTEGKLLIVPAKDGASKLKRLAHCILISVPPPPGLKLEEQQEELQHTLSDGGFCISLPDWARTGSNPDVAPSKLAGDRPAALEINGNTLILGGREAKLTHHQALMIEKLNSNFGKCVSKAALHHHLYSDDADGGPEEKILDVMVCRIRELIEGWPITIVTHWGKGYELRRAVT